MADIQLWIVVAVVGAAVAFLWRRYTRARQGLAPMCGNCDNCSGESEPR
jgi:hypothetical protein